MGKLKSSSKRNIILRLRPCYTALLQVYTCLPAAFSALPLNVQQEFDSPLPKIQAYICFDPWKTARWRKLIIPAGVVAAGVSR